MPDRSDDPPAALTAPLAAALSELQATELSRLSREDLLAVVRELETARRRLDAVDHAVVGELDARGVAHELARRDTATLLSELLLIAPGEATARVAAARDLAPRRDLAGQPLPPLFPAAAAAQAAGQISTAHVRVITGLIEKLPAAVEAEHGASVEAFLVEQARRLHPRDLSRLATRLRDTLDPDGRLTEQADHLRRREVRLRPCPDGGAELGGYLTPAAAATWETILDALSAPAPAADGTRDERSAGQRRHDGFLDAGLRLLRSDTLPDAGGAPVTILATLTAEQLATQTGHASTAHGHPIPVTELLNLAAEADIIPVVLNSAGGILGYGRTRRLATPALRHALAARDGGCSFPNCTIPPAWCQAHHVQPWVEGGETDLDNLALVCGYHHREHSRLGWTCTIIDGVPHWVPPAWLDPIGLPRRNILHHHHHMLLESAPPTRDGVP